ncbi:hypothetical protein Clocl_3112 [Acetivibrio clariflavus DSM 19732]|uniref:Uncharacterized protein n=2 Tax=Acetivibrio clariflavus TaxID=288965 RepID=G8LVK3_ACECE|nr:hypothetical protein Clocl_3112 [Acetivibrio clariflavus DSM 19732]
MLISLEIPEVRSMGGYLKRHEQFVNEALEKKEDVDWEWLKEYHKTQIQFLQHERLIHLLVTLAFALFFLATVLFATSFEKPVILLVSLLVLVLLVPYIAHYYKLENGVQRWYELYNKIDEICRKKE